MKRGRQEFKRNQNKVALLPKRPDHLKPCNSSVVTPTLFYDSDQEDLCWLNLHLPTTQATLPGRRSIYSDSEEDTINDPTPTLDPDIEYSRETGSDTSENDSDESVATLDAASVSTQEEIPLEMEPCEHFWCKYPVREPGLDNIVWVLCDNCGKWFHVDCLNLLEADILLLDNKNSRFSCYNCGDNSISIF